MIHRLAADHPLFRDIRFEPGLNVVLADRTLDSTKLDSRNGLGKSTLIEILHFCLGGNIDRRTALAAEILHEWSFTLEFDAGGSHVSATRGLDNTREVLVDGANSDWPLVPQRDALGQHVFPIGEWTSSLGSLLFGLPGAGRQASKANGKYRPSFRALISHFMRRGQGAYLSPFQFFPQEPEWETQVTNMFLLDLNWADARDWQSLKDRRKDLVAFEKAMKTPVGQGMLGSAGELEAAKVRLQAQVADRAAALESFRVHPQYRELQQSANVLTTQIHELTNSNVMDSRLIAAYRDSILGENAPTNDDVVTLFREAGVELPGAVVRRLGEVTEFHVQIIENRRAFLEAETSRLSSIVERRNGEIAGLTDRRAEVMSILSTHGALEEFTRLQEQHTRTVQDLRDVDARIDALKRLQKERSSLRIELETLRQTAQLHFDESRPQRDWAIRLFNQNSEALYDAPGNLVIDVGENGFRFDVEIQRSGSHGIENMKILCYDLAIAEIASARVNSPGFLIHDSTIFDGVDERQVARALELAAARSEYAGFQYIVMMNSDSIPRSEFSDGFDFDGVVRHRLTDADESGALLGVRVQPPEHGGVRLD